MRPNRTTWIFSTLAFAGYLIGPAAAQPPAPQILPIDQIPQLERQVAQHPDNLAAVQLLADNYAAVILGVTSLSKNGLVDQRDLNLAATEFASHARQALTDSKLPALQGQAAQALVRFRFGGSAASLLPRDLQKDAVRLAEQLLAGAIALDPKNQEFRQQRIELTIQNSNFNGLPVSEAWDQVSEDVAAMSGSARYYALAHVAELAERSGKLDDASKLAQELIAGAGTSAADWNSGNALHAGNMVLGKVALARGDVAAAEAFLLKSASSIPAGSPQLNSFGPNMSLALDLLKAGHPLAVQQYFELCRVFWKMGGARLDAWTAAVNADTIPKFGPNLVY